MQNLSNLVRSTANVGRRHIAIFFLTLVALLSPSPTAKAQTNYITAYDSMLEGSWVRYCWEINTLYTDFAAQAPGLTDTNAIEVDFTTNDYYYGFGLANLKPGFDQQFMYLNEFRSIEFDIYFAADSSSPTNLIIILDDAGYSQEPPLTTYIPNWDSLTDAQRYGNWFHVVIDLKSLQPTEARFWCFLLFNNGDYTPHFFMRNVRLGWVEDTNPPVITVNSVTLAPTYDSLTLNFSTDEDTIASVQYGVGNYNSVVSTPPDGWTNNQTLTLPNLLPGTTVQYQIVANVHRTDTNATMYPGYASGSYVIPPAPTTPPVISGLAATNVFGNRATVVWTTDRPCDSQLSYQSAGGSSLTRQFPNLAATNAVILDLLQPLTTYNVSLVVTDSFHLITTTNFNFTSTAASVPDVIITVNTNVTHKISPWIYGINFVNQLPNPPRNIPFDRHGGNRWTAYNWENNASNAGNDYYYESDDYLGGGDVPDEAVRMLVDSDRTNGIASLITVPMQGYVAADENGDVDISDPNHIAERFKQIVFQKGAPFTNTPSTTDAYVYIDESLWALRGKFTNDIFADATMPTFVSLDNEPELWPSTHQEIQGTSEPDVTNYIQRTIELSAAIKNLDPAAKTFGPVHYGFYGISFWQGAPEFTADYWFTDQYLQTLRTASATYGSRLLDVYDIHWYSEATSGGTRIGWLTSSNLTSDQIQAIAQSPRSLWDTNYTETSWIANYFGGPIYILKRLQDKINADWPGTGLSVTEYDNGGGYNIAGAIAEADSLGVYGSLGLFAASYWPPDDSFPFVAAGFKMFRDFDGNLGSFGDTSLSAESSATTNVSAYVSLDSQHPNRNVIVAINRSEASHDVSFSGIGVSGLAQIYRIQNQQTDPVYVGSVPANLASWVVTLPPLSVSTIQITQTGTYSNWATNVFTSTELQNTNISGLSADPDHSGVPNLYRYAFNLPAHGAIPKTLIPSLQKSGGQSTPAVTFTRQTSAADVIYHVEGSSDLVHWTDVSILAAGSPSPVTVADATPLSTGKPHYLRVRVEYLPEAN